MKYASLAAAAALILLASAFALVHTDINRTDPPEAEITLTERELSYSSGSDDSGVALILRWVDTSVAPGVAIPPPGEPRATLLNQAKLEELGFDCRVPPSDPSADTYYAYSRQSARTGFAAFEYDGPAWKSWIEWRERLEPRPPEAQKRSVDYDRETSSRLALVDAGFSARALRTRYPDRSRVLVLPAVFRISLISGWPAARDRPAAPARLAGFLQEIPSVIHVPKPFSDRFRSDTRTYFVTLRYGRLHEPWVTAVTQK